VSGKKTSGKNCREPSWGSRGLSKGKGGKAERRSSINEGCFPEPKRKEERGLDISSRGTPKKREEREFSLGWGEGGGT